MAHSLVKCCNNVAGQSVDALWVSFSAPMTVLRLLARGTAIPCEACLVMNAEKLTEYGNIILKEY
jgi:hypothetical protein